VYAKKRDSDVYHLVDLHSFRTLCGLQIDQAVNSPITLQLKTRRPHRAKLCRHCDDVADQQTT
ncbi:MAG TPA: hypothetical protein VFM05_04790, partial [Candidatus Saccharimonadales bacterium]|nr:hypothetical protein [Candidatus Saccharimonadales bacterium]